MYIEVKYPRCKRGVCLVMQALLKKLRQSEALQARHAAGEKLSPEEQEKVGKVAGWWVPLSL